ncbi:hypothetical protein PC116_g32068, partial [Phytophthora cactorum]
YKRVEDVAALYGDAGAQSFFARDGDGGASTFPPRKGRRPEIPSFVAPQRQLSEQAPPPTVAAEKAFLDALAAANPTLFEARASKLEGPLHRALWLRMPSDPDKKKLLQTRLGRGADGEFAHVHGEGSLHLTLSPADAKNAIEAGWAERHKLAGVWGQRAVVPWGYVMVYAPRSEEEFALMKEIILAGARYVAEGSGVEVVAPKEE